MGGPVNGSEGKGRISLSKRDFKDLYAAKSHQLQLHAGFIRLHARFLHAGICCSSTFVQNSSTLVQNKNTTNTLVSYYRLFISFHLQECLLESHSAIGKIEKLMLKKAAGHSQPRVLIKNIKATR